MFYNALFFSSDGEHIGVGGLESSHAFSRLSERVGKGGRERERKNRFACYGRRAEVNFLCLNFSPDICCCEAVRKKKGERQISSSIVILLAPCHGIMYTR